MATPEREALQRASTKARKLGEVVDDAINNDEATQLADLAKQLDEFRRVAGRRVAFRNACNQAQEFRRVVNGVFNNHLEGRRQRVFVGNVDAEGWRFIVRLHDSTTVLSCSTPLRKFDGTSAVWYEVRIKGESGPEAAGSEAKEPYIFDSLNGARDFVVQQVRAQANAK